MSKNIRFSYLYRDAGNYKTRGSVVFSNPDSLSLDSIEKSLKSAFLQDGLFIAGQIQVPEVFPFAQGQATSDDHCFHEFETVEFTRVRPNDQQFRSVTELISDAVQESRRGWACFDLHAC
jgi:hypothetical protein